MSGTNIRKNGVIIRTSRNLRGMCDYARTSPVRLVDACRDPENAVRGVLVVTYADGATSRASFASYHIMIDFVRNRRTWRGVVVSLQEDIGYLTKPGIIAGGVHCTTPPSVSPLASNPRKNYSRPQTPEEVQRFADMAKRYGFAS